jgi:pimeloyl-ACP methyl ester carboxylesterase
MAAVAANGVTLHWHESGAGEPLVLVHGSWLDGRSWRRVVPRLASELRVIAYDRRGHGASRLPPGPCGIAEHAADLSDLIERLDLAPAHVAGSSWGGAIALRLACDRPELVRSLAVHEPPLFDLVDGDPDCREALGRVRASIDAVVAELSAGETTAGAARFVDELALGPGSWARLARAEQRRYVACAPAYLAQSRDPERMRVDPVALAAIECPVLLTEGDVRGPLFGRILDRVSEALPDADRRLLAGTAHAPQLSHPGAYAATIGEFAAAPRAVR